MIRSSRFRILVGVLLLQGVTPLLPRQPHGRDAPSTTQRSVALSHPPTTVENVSRRKNRVATKREDKIAHEYRWLTWLYQHWKDVPVGNIDGDICKMMVPALSAYARRQTSQAAEQAEGLLDRYLEEYRAGNPAVVIENTAFHAVMDAFSKCAAPERAQKTLQKMLDVSRSDERFSHLKPDVFSFTILATGWARSRHPNAADKAERLLHHMELKGMTVTTLTYNVVLNAIAVSHDPQKALRAAKIVRKMQQLAVSGREDCQPDLYTYQSWIHACSRTRGGVPQTITILKYLDDEAASGNTSLRPNAYCFAAAIHAWAYSSEPEKSIRANELLQDMRQRYEIYGQRSCRPNVVVFTSVINACVKPATSADRQGAFQIAQLVFDELIQSSYGVPNFLTYAAFLHVCGTTLEESRRDAAVRRIFGLCRQHGCVGKIVVQKMREYASADLYEELMGGFENWEEMPASWKHKVKGERFNNEGEFILPNHRRAKTNVSGSASYSESIDFISAQRPFGPRKSFSKTSSKNWEMRI